MNQRIAAKIVKESWVNNRFRTRCNRHWRWPSRGHYSAQQVCEAIGTISTGRLRSIVEQPHERGLWGKEYVVRPQLVSHRFGDGRRLLILSPIIDRPNYFLVRIGSRQDPHDEVASDNGDYLIDEIYEAIEDEYGRSTFECDQCGDEDCDCPGTYEQRHYPTPNFECGSQWGFWPPK
jgi:hypothetical protein